MTKPVRFYRVLPVIAMLMVAHSAAADDRACHVTDGLRAPAVHGTARSAQNDHGQLVLALDRRQGEACPPDGRAELVFLFQPEESEQIAGLIEATSEAARNITVEYREESIRVTVPGHHSWVLGMPGEEAAGSGATFIEGLAVSRVDRGIRAVGLDETLNAYRGFDLVQGPGED